MNGPGRLSIALASFPLFMASMAVAAAWLVEPAKAEGPAATGQGLTAQGPTVQSLASLTITIGKISPRGGILRLGLYDQAGYPNDNSKPIASADVPVTGAVMTVTLKDIPPGRYALQSLQDINGNGKMDSSWIGLPEEPYGFSRDAKPLLSKPGFDAVAFTLNPGDNTQTLNMQNS